MLRTASLMLALLLAAAQALAAELVSPFAGSEALGEYRADFMKYYYLPSAEKDAKPEAVEGRIESRLYAKPEEKSNFEVFRSFENSLRSAGFDVLVAMDDKRRVELTVRELNGPRQNDMGKRPYMKGSKRTGALTIGRIATQAQHYIAARKRIDDKDVLLAIYTSRSGGYAIEQLESAAMEENTVVITLDALKKTLDDEGRIAIYGILFDTGSAAIKPESKDTLATIVEYLSSHPERAFYVVGHTDDEGSLDGNMKLSAARAEAVVEAVMKALPTASGRLEAYGVGPLSPVATNGVADGRQLNRRVELVSRLAK